MAMTVFALDTTTRAGSMALLREGRVLEERTGDPALTHGARLPGEILDLLARHGVTLREIDLYGVAAGPGSFTGLRIGIAAVQGLAFAHQRPVAGVSALEALARRTLLDGPAPACLGIWMDAQRHEVFSALWEVPPEAPAGTGGPGLALAVLEEAAVGAPEATLDRWLAQLGGRPLLLAGDGALRYRDRVHARAPQVEVRLGVPPLAATIGRMAIGAAEAGQAGGPAAIRPIYVRRPDAELARDRKAAAAAPAAETEERRR
ncbi:MAG: tRNA (adenosine(37)-N6)-threonylcarbamoyltransferase complex dimerization subunit type 1 TsaB [Acidobacteriota bacterium]|nr:tRNA (adenosine(37)-N6)-threonylcarbamoyltransferase complex dimerization subunit type 1 TsaB [Acidobacteriota bacterium]